MLQTYPLELFCPIQTRLTGNHPPELFLNLFSHSIFFAVWSIYRFIETSSITLYVKACVNSNDNTERMHTPHTETNPDFHYTTAIITAAVLACKNRPALCWEEVLKGFWWSKLPALPLPSKTLTHTPVSAQRSVGPRRQQRCGVKGVQLGNDSSKVLGGLGAKHIQHLPVHQGKPRHRRPGDQDTNQPTTSAVDYSTGRAQTSRDIPALGQPQQELPIWRPEVLDFHHSLRGDYSTKSGHRTQKAASGPIECFGLCVCEYYSLKADGCRDGVEDCICMGKVRKAASLDAFEVHGLEGGTRTQTHTAFLSRPRCVFLLKYT